MFGCLEPWRSWTILGLRASNTSSRPLGFLTGGNTDMDCRVSITVLMACFTAALVAVAFWLVEVAVRFLSSSASSLSRLMAWT